MALGRSMVGFGKVALVLGLGLLPVLTACGKSEKSGDGSGDNRGGGTGGPTTNVVVKTVTQSGVDKIDLLFMIDNSISMADKQALLAQAVPVLVERLVDPVCVDSSGNPTPGTASSGCPGARPEFSPIKDIHIGIITSSLGNHGGEVCVSDPAEMPPRNLNDSAQLLATVRTGLYSYQNQGFLVWDPRMGAERPLPERHPNLGAHEQSVSDFVQDFAMQVQAVGERGCAYEASLEAWYRFLIDPEPINQVTNDGAFSVRGPVNNLVITQRAAFMRPDSLLAIVMLTDENDCSINDENGQQGWLTGRRAPMPRGSDACSHPENPDLYRCCIPCVLLDAPGFQPVQGCSYGGDVSCNSGSGSSLSTIEDSTALRCYRQTQRFGVNLLYPWQRYVDGLTRPNITLRNPDTSGRTEVSNPIYTPGVDGTPARELGQVFLVGIVGVPWQDLATQPSIEGPGLTYLTATEMNAPVDANNMPFGPNRWDVILGDPDSGRSPTDPFMIESIEERQAGAANPVPGVQAVIAPSTTTAQANVINGHEQNIVNRDDLQYACTFELPEEIPCDSTNQDGCDCNASEEAYNRPLCRYESAGGDGTQTHGKAYPGVRQLQVLKGFGDNAIVASICPKNVQANGSPASDPNYGYNPAVAALIQRLKEALVATCLPRPLSPDESGQVPCTVIETMLPGSGSCSCDESTGRSEIPRSDPRTAAVQQELIAFSLCGGSTGVSCSDYCLCEIQKLSGSELDACQNLLTDPGNIYGYCYVDAAHGNPGLIAQCPETQQQIIRFLGPDLPAPRSVAFVACTGATR